MLWRCTLAHERGSHLHCPSPLSLLSYNASWRCVWSRQRTCSASQDQKPSSTTSSAIRCSNRLACVCRAEPPTIWRILRQAGCIQQDRRRKPRPLELRQPGEEVQFDLKDESLVPADPEGKQAHMVEVANFVDAGTSIWLHHQVRSDFAAEALLEVVVQFLRQHGLPGMLTFDNDPRFVGSASGRDFPSALVRFLWCVGVVPSAHPAAPAGQECLRGTISPLPWSGMLAGASTTHVCVGQ